MGGRREKERAFSLVTFGGKESVKWVVVLVGGSINCGRWGSSDILRGLFCESATILVELGTR